MFFTICFNKGDPAQPKNIASLRYDDSFKEENKVAGDKYCLKYSNLAYLLIAVLSKAKLLSKRETP